ncbi:MAG: winged helix-turn-helix domain-containing protein, partial [Bacteroidales bacterium]|nr:winged helix-turn-helix domain-containing protein [Candidatus Sodaliphilus fimicaballi]
QTDKVFLFNILNYLSSSNRRHTTSLQLMRSGSIAERLAREIMELTMQRSTDVRLQYRQKDLCTLLGTQRNSLVTALDAMAQDGLIEYTSSEIKIPSVRALQAVFQD